MFSTNFPEGYLDQKVPAEDQKAQWPKCGNNKNVENALHVT